MLMAVAGLQGIRAMNCPWEKVSNFLVIPVREKEATVEKIYGENAEK
jgi:hypothetical protein